MKIKLAIYKNYQKICENCLKISKLAGIQIPAFRAFCKTGNNRLKIVPRLRSPYNYLDPPLPPHLYSVMIETIS